jgi:hypothetical protein
MDHLPAFDDLPATVVDVASSSGNRFAPSTARLLPQVAMVDRCRWNHQDVGHADERHGKSAPRNWLLAVILGLAGDSALWLWMRGGPLIDPTARAMRHGHAEELDLVDLQARFWYGLAFSTIMTLVGALIVARKRRFTSCGMPLLLFGVVGPLPALAIYCSLWDS